MEVNDIQVGDLVKMSYGSIYTIGGIYSKDPPYDLESTQDIPLKSSDVEKILNKYHIGDRVISINNHSFKGTVIEVKGYGVSTIGMIVYEVRMDDTRRTFNACEEDIILMNEEERKEFDDLKERVEFLEHAVRNQTALITKITDTMYAMAKAIKEDKKNGS